MLVELNITRPFEEIEIVAFEVISCGSVVFILCYCRNRSMPPCYLAYDLSLALDGTTDRAVWALRTEYV
jgi:hypothetical protein